MKIMEVISADDDIALNTKFDRFPDRNKVVKARNMGIWGGSHSGSSLVTGASADFIGVPNTNNPESIPNYRTKGLALRFLKAIANSPGSSEPLFHGFKNTTNRHFQVGEILTLPLTATSGDMDGSAGYGIHNSGGQETNPTVFAFPIGTPIAGYSKWKKADAKEFGHWWSEAIVAGKFQVTGTTKRKVYGWRDREQYLVIHLKPVAIFDITTKQWRQI